MTTRPLILGLSMLAISLGACSRSAPDRSSAESVEMNAAAPTAPPPVQARDDVASESAVSDQNASAEAPPAPAPLTNSSAELSTEVPIAAPVDQQMMDDAEATGMTSRASRGDNKSADTAPRQTEPN